MSSTFSSYSQTNAWDFQENFQDCFLCILTLPYDWFITMIVVWRHDSHTVACSALSMPKKTSHEGF